VIKNEMTIVSAFYDSPTMVAKASIMLNGPCNAARLFALLQ
jgi:hypothetical protein